jgi:spore germination protein GerM
MDKKHLALCLMLLCLCLMAERTAYSITAKSAVSAGATKTVRVKVYLVAVGDNGKKGRRIGCEDSLIPIRRTIRPTRAPLKAALDELLSMPPEHNEGGQQLGNYWRGSDLKVQSVRLQRGTATIRITGELTVAGICDQPRITEQINATARQFLTVKRVRVFVNGQPLREAIR